MTSLTLLFWCEAVFPSDYYRSIKNLWQIEQSSLRWQIQTLQLRFHRRNWNLMVPQQTALNSGTREQSSRVEVCGSRRALEEGRWRRTKEQKL